MLKQVNIGDYVTLNFTGRFENGEIFDSSNTGEPLQFVVGSGMMIKGLDQAVIGMKIGEKKQVIIPPELAFGLRNDNLIFEVKRNQFKSFEPKLGMQLKLELPDERTAIATVIAVEDDSVTLDLNHPLAGKTLYFDIEVVNIEDGSFACDCDDDCCVDVK